MFGKCNWIQLNFSFDSNSPAAGEGNNNPIFGFYRATPCVNAVFAVARCLSVMFVYCIQMAEDIVKLLSQHSSPIILVFYPKRRYPIPMGTPSAGAQNTRGWEKFAIFD